MKILLIGDTHCGSAAGLTHPDFIAPDFEPVLLPFWNWYENTIRDIGHVDMAVHLGDAVDGEGKKENIGQLTTNTKKQAEMAIKALEIVDTDKWRFVYGTPYHTSGTYDYEEPIAEHFNAPIKDEYFLNLRGTLASFRHVTGRSDTAYGQGTPLFREAVRDMVSSITSEHDEAEYIFRGHVHYYFRAENGRKSVISCPCLQLPGSVYGRKMRSMFYDMGVIVLHVGDKIIYVEKIIMPLKISLKREVEHHG